MASCEAMAGKLPHVQNAATCYLAFEPVCSLSMQRARSLPLRPAHDAVVLPFMASPLIAAEPEESDFELFDFELLALAAIPLGF